jgi:hypothetical protein
MNHRPFEDWLLDDQPLTTQQHRELQQHLRTCTSCSAIAESNLALHSARWIAAPTGFTQRHVLRIERWKADQRRRQAVGTLILVFGGLAILGVLIGPTVMDVLNSPAGWITTVASYVVAMLAAARMLGALSNILLRDLPRFVSPGSWLGLAAMGTALAAIWTITMRRLARAPQGV